MSLAEDPPDLPYPKLPFWDTVSLSYSTYFNHFIDALRASWVWLIVVAALTGFASWQQWSWLADAMANLKPGLPAMPGSAEISLLMQLDNILLLFAGVSIAVAWHRLVILNEQPGFSGSNIATKNLWRYVVAAIGLLLIMFLPVTAIMVPTFYFVLSPSVGRTSTLPPGFLPLIMIVFVAYAVGIAVAFRLTLLLPAQAIGDTGLTIKQVWTRTRGNIWRILWGIAVTTIPPLLIAQIVFLLVMQLPHPGMAADGLVVRMTAFTTVFTTYYLLIVPIGIGFLSHAYRHFFETPQELPE